MDGLSRYERALEEPTERARVMNDLARTLETTPPTLSALDCQSILKEIGSHYDYFYDHVERMEAIKRLLPVLPRGRKCEHMPHKKPLFLLIESHFVLICYS